MKKVLYVLVALICVQTAVIVALSGLAFCEDSLVHYENVKLACRHEAILAASLAIEKYPVRIRYGPSFNGEWHAQAQAQINGKWYWIHTHGDSGYYISKMDYPNDFKPKYSASLVEYVERHADRYKPGPIDSIILSLMGLFNSGVTSVETK